MRQWSAGLVDELRSWPKTKKRPMFGLVSFYAKGRIFAAIPRTRAAFSANSIMLKLPAKGRMRERLEADPRMDTSEIGRSGWLGFELSSDADLRDALRWLEVAYESASKK